MEGQETAYKTYATVKVENTTNKNECFTAFIEIKDSTQNVKLGDVLSGIFYIDSVSKIQIKNGRFEGENTRVLVSVQIDVSQAFDYGVQNQKNSLLINSQKILSKIRWEQANPGSENSEIQKAFSSMIFFQKILEEVNLKEQIHRPYFDLLFMLSLFWHLQNSQNTGSLIYKLLAKAGKTTNEEILNWKHTGKLKINLAIFDQDYGSLLLRMKRLAGGLAVVEVLPTVLDEESLRYWLLLKKNSIIVVNNFDMLPSKLKGVVAKSAEKKTIFANESTEVELSQSFIFLFSTKSQIKNINNGGFKTNFNDWIDLWVDLNTLRFWSPVDREPMQTLFLSIEKTVGLLIHPFSSKPETDKTVKLSKISSFAESESLSQNSRISDIWNRICKKFSQKDIQGDLLYKGNIPKANYYLASKLIVGFVSILKDESRVSFSNILTLKKVATSLRIIRAFFKDDSTDLSTIFKNEANGIFEVELIDALISIMIFDHSRAISLENYSCVFDNFPSRLVYLLNDAWLCGSNWNDDRNKDSQFRGNSLSSDIPNFLADAFEHVLSLINLYL